MLKDECGMLNEVASSVTACKPILPHSAFILQH
jgi:hypothetical protein